MKNRILKVSFALAISSCLLFTACGAEQTVASIEESTTENIVESTEEEVEESVDTVIVTEEEDEVDDTLVEIEETETNEDFEKSETTGGGSMTSENVPEGDKLTEMNQEAEEEANAADENLNESDGVVIVEELDERLYVQQNCNAHSGDGINYDVVVMLEYAAKVHVTGRTENDWYRVKYGNSEVYVSASLLGSENPLANNNSGNGGDTDGDSTVTNDDIDWDAIDKAVEETFKNVDDNPRAADELAPSIGGGKMIDPFQ